jgi:outer membrane protein, heavy metal efflux system
MQANHQACLLAGFVAGGCETYSPEPVDLSGHAQLFDRRVPDAEDVRAFAAKLRERVPAMRVYDATDGIDQEEGRVLALLFNAELREIRLRAGVATASRDQAGRWQDPQLSFDFAKILETVDHPWIVASSIGLTLPITGRPGLERKLADARAQQALVEARAAETRVLDEVEVHFVAWSACREQARALIVLVDQLRSIESVARRLAETRQITNIDARVFALERLIREGERIRLEARVRELELGLKQLLGLAPQTEVTFVPAFTLPLRAPAADPAAGPDGPRIARRRAEYETAERDLELAVRKQWPELFLAPGFAEEDAQPRATLGFSLPLPLWNRNAREIAEARASRSLGAELLRAEYEQVVQELARAQVLLDAAAQQRRHVEEQVLPLADQQVTDVERLGTLGQVLPLLMLEGLVRAYDVKVQLLEARLDEARATAKVNSFSWATLSTGAEVPR